MARLAATATALTNAASLTFTITFSESVIGVTNDDFIITSTGTGGSVGTPSSSDGGVTWTVQVTGAGEGTLRLDLKSSGTAILIEYAIAPAAIAVFIGAYCESLFGIGGWMIYLAFYIIFIGIHIFGVGEALKLMFVITAVAAIALGVFLVAMVPHFNVANLLDIPVTEAKGASTFLPFGYVGVWAAIPYAIWFFLAVEGVPLAAEETKNPKRDLPRGLIGAIVVLTSFALLILVIAPGGAGTYALIKSGNPLVEALALSYGGSTWMGSFVNLVGLAGLIASFFSIIYAYSRQIFALSRAGYLPRKLSQTNKSKAPVLALVIPGIIGFGLSLTGQGDLLILVAVFGATISYVLMMAAHITLRIRHPKRIVRIEGYTDNTGGTEDNLALSLARAQTVADMLADLGIDEKRIQVAGYGDQYPVDVNATERGRAQNRRVEIVFSDEKGRLGAAR